ncbi:hypothetical protein PTKIN_Ptkin01aG0018400 [Pterospermum kingtungense]
MGLRSVVLVELILVTFISAVKATVDTAALAKSNCQSQCGDVTIPYPFGIGDDCNININFSITCNTTFNPPKPFYGNIEVLNISLDGQFRILTKGTYVCYDQSGTSSSLSWASLSIPKFPINNTINKFTAIGCDTIAMVEGLDGPNYATDCVLVCTNTSDAINGSCSGIGCCQTNIPKGARNYNITLDSGSNHTDILHQNPCSYAFVTEESAYNFSISDLGGYGFQDREFPVTLDWTIGDISCDKARKNSTSFECKENDCIDSENGGYLCKCFEGFDGNPYLSDGCKDINERETKRPCVEVGRCENSPSGNYTCVCPKGYDGDGRINGTGCIRNEKRFPVLVVALGTSSGILCLLLAILMLYLMLKQRQISTLREKYFQQNGGNLLREQLSKRQGCGENVKIFAAEELEKATNNYHESRILGQGGQGTVYQGILGDNQMVAIKKSRIGDQSQVEPFINEIMVLCQINHRNVVKLLGCCLETQVPLLVYEYVTNGSLFDHMHNVAAASVLPWQTRLRIATETAEALSYLHSAASVPIIHRDIKLANILLDDHYTAKVSDFGASRLIPFDQAEITTIVQGTFGYLDPEYMLTSQLTEKSDVYSFGVVLIELLTGQKVVSFERAEEKRVLAMYFISLMKEDRWQEIVDPRVLKHGNADMQLKEVAALAWRCVRVKGEKRPTMKEVAHELAGLQAMTPHPWSKSNLEGEESENLLGKFCNTYDDGTATRSSMVYDSMNNDRIAFELEEAR